MTFCAEKHPQSPNGCYEFENHNGPHRGYETFASEPFFWDGETRKRQTTLTQAEVGILLTALVPVETFFPELRKKLELMQANG